MNLPSIWTTGSTEAIKTGTWRSALPHYIAAPAPCHQACPVNGDIAQWIGLARQRDWRGAWDVLTRNNPFPAVAGRICHHPCESACNRAGFDDALAICKLERTVGDIALQNGWTFPLPEREHTAHVAIVGAGPAGLLAAFQLRRLGYRVSLYEAQAELGGLMRYGIPPYRLARSVRDGEIARIVALGVEVFCGVTIRSEHDLARLRRDHNAVFLGTGAQRPKRLSQLPPNAPWLMDGATYLASANAGKPPALGRRLVVIGGGSAALDVARSARRAGQAVTILALETAQQMPAQHEEVVEAREEAITIVDGAMLKEVTELDDGALELQCQRVVFTPGSAGSPSTLTPLPEDGFLLQADAIVSAIGQDPDLAALAAFTLQGNLVSVNRQQATSFNGFWAGGDLASMARFVTEAIGMGKRAALDIDRTLQARVPGGTTDGATAQAVAAPAATPADATPVVGLHNIATTYHPPQARVTESRLPPQQRVASGAEVQLPLELEQALIESARCFSCGNCTQCDNCFHYCPDLAIRRVDGGGYVVLTDYCKGCGICVAECPTGSMAMHEETR